MPGIVRPAPRRVFRPLSDWPFAVKMGMPSGLALLAMIWAGAFGYVHVNRQAALLAGVVHHDLRIANILSRCAGDLQAANGGVYRLLTLRAAHAEKLNVNAETGALIQRIESIRGRLAAVESDVGSANAASLHIARNDLGRYRDTITVVGSMLEVDFDSAVALVHPFDANARAMVATLSRVTEDVIDRANASALQSAREAQAAGIVFVTTTVLVLLIVGFCSSEIIRRTVASVRRIAQATLLVAGGDQALRVDELGRRDELGAIVTSLQRFQSSNARVNFLAHHDALTGLPNRVRFHDRMTLALAARGLSCALHCLDLDRFKAVNDTLGHPLGDLLLQVVSERLIACVREGDTVARLGGDEFAIVQCNVRSVEDAERMARRVTEAVGQPFEILGHQINIGISVGLVIGAGDTTDVEAMLRSADVALYLAKAEGRSTWCVYHPDMEAALHQRRLMELDLRAALAGDQFEVYYQPLVNVKSRQVSGFEALIRWHHPVRGMVSPADFIPLAEQSGLIVQIGAWVLHQATRDAVAWPGELKVAVNLSPVQFKDIGLIETITDALRSAGLPANRLELEITEGVLLNDNEPTLQTLFKLRALGIRISMDDFGTGYSSLSYLRSFPFDKIKIDQSFIRDIGLEQGAESGGAVAIVRAVTGLSSSLGIATTAEGVENEDQLARLIAEGCTEVQGYLFSRPYPARDVGRMISDVAQRPSNKLIAVMDGADLFRSSSRKLPVG